MDDMRRFMLSFNGALVALLVMFVSVVGATSANISNSFYGPTNAPKGSIVSIDPTRPDHVVLANTKNSTNLVGVTLPAKDSLLAINGQDTKVQVATSGIASVLVTTVNGNVSIGDQIGVSPFNGFGMKAIPGSQIIGLAQTSLNASTRGAAKQTVTDNSGKTSEIAVGLITMNISVGVDTAAKKGEQLNGLQKLVKSMTGRTISTFRIVTALAVALVATIALITLIYASIFGSIISIGRNPLAKFAILRSLGIVVAMAFLIAFVAGATIIFLLN